MPEEAYRRDLLGTMVLKVRCGQDQQLSLATLNGRIIPAFFCDGDFVFLCLPRLGRERYELRFALGSSAITGLVYHDGTFNVYDVVQEPQQMTVEVKMYGSQDVKVRCQRPEAVDSLTPSLYVDDWSYDDARGIAVVRVRASDFQGVKGMVRLSW
jgi:hypothetical protein